MKPLLAFLFIASLAGAQTGQTGRQLVHSDGSARRMALVIGNDAYPNNSLHNAVNDARSMKRALEDAGFSVRMSLNTTHQQMETEVDEFTGGVNPGDIALFFYAGHGMQISDQNYLIPVDFRARTAVDARHRAYPAQWVQEKLVEAGAKLQIIVLDACRNNPFRGWRGGGDGLAAMQAGRGTYIAFATAPGKTAADSGGGQNGLFTGELVTVLREPDLSIDQVFNRVRAQVIRKSGGQQLPWSTSLMEGEFYFKVKVKMEGAVSSPANELAAAPSGDRELAFWNSVKDENDSALLEEYLRRYPAGDFTNIANAKLNRLKAAIASPPAVTSPAKPVPGTVKVNPKDGQRYVWIPPGRFMMGCSPGDSECREDEKPSHEVEITKGFWMGQTSVTVGAWKRYAGATGNAMPPEPKFGDRALNSGWRDDQQPVVDITWAEASEYCQYTGGRLPTEAEWEYAARGESSGSRYGSLDAIAWYADNSGKARIDSAEILKTDSKNYASRVMANGIGLHGVGQKKPNAWKLYDMLGNVWQWTSDSYGAKYYEQREGRDPHGPTGGEYRALRGGSWLSLPRVVRVSSRLTFEPINRHYYNGVRCVGE